MLGLFVFFRVRTPEGLAVAETLVVVQVVVVQRKVGGSRVVGKLVALA